MGFVVPVFAIDRSAVPRTVTAAVSVLLAGLGSGVELDTLAELVTVTAPALVSAAAVAVIVIVAVPFAASVPSEQDTVVSQLPWLVWTATSVREVASIGSLTVTF